jgi:hypothetical protein
MWMKSWDARMKVCGQSRASGTDKPCLRHGCGNWQWDPKSVKPGTDITTANKDDFIGRCGLEDEPKCRVLMSGDV